jgi:hypothetical protein
MISRWVDGFSHILATLPATETLVAIDVVKPVASSSCKPTWRRAGRTPITAALGSWPPLATA